MTYKIKLDLSKLIGAKVTRSNDGKNVVIIPIAENDIFVSNRSGSAYLTLLAKESPKEWQTHGIKQYLSKKFLETLPEDMRNTPFVGSMSEFSYNNTQNNNQYEQTESSRPSYERRNDNFDDLVF